MNIKLYLFTKSASNISSPFSSIKLRLRSIFLIAVFEEYPHVSKLSLVKKLMIGMVKPTKSNKNNIIKLYFGFCNSIFRLLLTYFIT